MSIIRSVLLILLLLVETGHSADLYFSNSGDDANDCSDGTTNACETIGDLNGKTVGDGDTVYFNGGDTFNDAIVAPTLVGAVTYTSYGTGQATISGEATITGTWVVSGSEWYIDLSAQVNDDDVYVVYENGVQMENQIYDIPNTEWATASSDTNSPVNTAVFQTEPATMWSNNVLQTLVTCPGDVADLASGEWCFGGSPLGVHINASNSADLNLSADGYASAQTTSIGSLSSGEFAYDRANQRLYIGNDPSGNTYTFTKHQYVFNITDEDNVTFKNLTITKAHQAGIYIELSGNHGTYTIGCTVAEGLPCTDGVTITEVGLNSVLTNLGANTLTGFDIIGNTLTSHARRMKNSAFGSAQDRAHNHGASLMLGTNDIAGGVTNVNIWVNLIDGNLTGSGSSFSSVRNALSLMRPNNVSIKGNEITEVDHTMFLGGSLTDVTVLYNKLHNSSDDFVSPKKDLINSAADFILAGNVLLTTGDDAIQIALQGGDTLAVIVNNTVYDWYQYGLALGNVSGNIIRNNIFINTATVVGCTGNAILDRGCFVYTEEDTANPSDFDSNVYWDITGTIGTQFVADDGGAGVSSVDFSGWQALTGNPDANGAEINPLINTSTGKVTATGLPEGTNVCDYIMSLLHPDATWSVGVMPRLTTICPNGFSGYSTNVGAYAFKRTCP